MQMDQNEVVCVERYGSSSIQRKYITDSRRTWLKMIEPDKRKLSNITSLFESVFLPQGFPDSVSGDYVHYQIWDSIQAFASSINGALSTHAILLGVGVGDETATTAAATITWLLKDGAGMVGQILFAWTNGSNLDCDPKKWRLFADFLNDIACFLALVSPYMKAFFTPIMCISSVSKALVGVAGGATRAALTQHQARRNNMADVSAKDGSQETLVNLSALICSLIMIPYITGNHMYVWSLFVALTIMHLYANFKAVSSVVMDTFNAERFQIAVNHYLASELDKISVSNVNKEESVWLKPWGHKLRIGVSLKETLEGYGTLHSLWNLYRNDYYLLNVKNASNLYLDIKVTLHKDSTAQTQMEALFQAFVLQYVLQRNHSKQKTYPWKLEMFPAVLTKDNADSLLRMSRDFTANEFPTFQKYLHNLDWNISHAFFGSDEWRATWNVNRKEIETL